VVNPIFSFFFLNLWFPWFPRVPGKGKHNPNYGISSKKHNKFPHEHWTMVNYNPNGTTKESIPLNVEP
jgi:hypothetical protein